MTAERASTDLLEKWLRRPRPSDDKYSRGVLGVETGSRAYPGAALLGILGALRTGIGMVRYSGPPSVGSLVIASHPEVVLTQGHVDAIVVGSGLGSPVSQRARARVLYAFSRGVPTVVDAGALDCAEETPSPSILTPHSRELARLHHRVLGHEVSDDLEAALMLARNLKTTILVKGSVTHVVTADGHHSQLPVATPWLATAGTGDVLAGILGALLASWSEHLRSTPGDCAEIAVAGALLHALAAQSASTARSGGPITATDVAEQVAVVVGETLEATT